MRETKLTFILLKSRYKSIGKLYAMTHQGAIVINRKSLKVDVPYNQWDKSKNRVKSGNPNAKEINGIIEGKIREFEIINQNIPLGDDNQCALVYMKNRIPHSGLTLSSIQKYEEILSNFEYVVFGDLKLKSLPFKMLRDISFVRLLKNEIRKSRKGHNLYKTNKGWLTYMTVFGKYVEDWNSNSGTQFPINIRPFTTDINKKEQKKLAVILTHEELQKLIEYQPCGYKNGYPQILSKNIFLFQYHTGGIRIIDALTLTNKDIVSDGLVIKIKKTKEIEKFPFCFEQVECLKSYYSHEYNSSIQEVRLGSIFLKSEHLIALNNIGGVDTINKHTLDDFRQIVDDISIQSNQQRGLENFLESLTEIEEILKGEIAQHFFSLLRKLPQTFLFPRLEWDLFKDAYSKNGDREFNKTHENLLHLAKAGHNSNLNRISKSIDIPKISGHTPRHTLANHLYNEGYNEIEIQKVLVHSNINTTKHYLTKRHQNNQVNNTVASANTIFRQKRNQLKKERK